MLIGKAHISRLNILLENRNKIKNCKVKSLHFGH